MPPELRDPKNGPLIEPVPRKPSPLVDLHEQEQPNQSFYYKRPSFFSRIYLTGVIHRPNDLLFLGHGLVSIIWTLVCLLIVDLPFLITTRFRTNSERHPVSWGAIYSFCMSMSRACSSSVHNVAQLRLVSNIITWFIPLRMLHLSSSSYSVKPNVQIKVHLNTLLEPERKTLAPTRARLNLDNSFDGIHRNPVNPSPEYLASFLPDNPHNLGRLANLPEESGDLNQDGTYTLRGEWIEALDDPKENRTRRDGREGAAGRAPRSNVVLLYCHGGGHVFCSATFHRQVVTRMLLEIGPGARAFVVDYRLAPEDPFPAAVHDIYAAYLYLTQPNHPAITLCTNGYSSTNNPHNHVTTPVLPKDIVLAGDSAGAGVAIAFQLYMRDYIQPSIEPKFEMPPVTVLISAWTDISTSMPSATSRHTYCYTPSPMGVNPFVDEATFYAFPKFNFARTYLCGDSKLVPNERNCRGRHMVWEWYRHLAQHPLVSPVYTADLSGLGGATLLQTGAFDRLADDTRLYAHKLGQANPDQHVRLELYRDMVHVHQFFEFLPMADKALCTMADFIYDSQEEYNNRRAAQQSSAKLKRKTNNKYRTSVNNGPGTGARKRGAGTEWIVVDTDGTEREGHDDEGCPISVLEDCWNPETREKAAANA
ncbi:hypothetical protein BG015_008664 [Linnemannia schmuckeri]|uniref:Alpha/beta hydrolase fold-3 domain-containing protein n=1 Tax=Linnemannia schmuckeri TaxID=64567 RepID=A0A9P5RWM5_9FUNG|nr:hypothetical protein BG015_008664 [Linnemannia schmuckeri]